MEERSCARSTNTEIRSWWKFARASNLNQVSGFVDSIQLEKKKCLHPINQACGVKPVILTHFTRVGEKLN